MFNRRKVKRLEAYVIELRVVSAIRGLRVFELESKYAEAVESLKIEKGYSATLERPLGNLREEGGHH